MTANSMPELSAAILNILTTRERTPCRRSALVGFSGIDASGKGFVTQQIASELHSRGIAVATINVDGWLNLPPRRFSRENPGQHFYKHALRLNEMFSDLVLPLRDNRSVRVTMDYAAETATDYEQRVVEFDDVDVVLLEGIFLFKLAFRDHFDLRVWIDCPFETALSRAIARGQECLPPEQTRRAYRTIYFPAQEIHFRRDDPRGCADLVIDNSQPECD